MTNLEKIGFAINQIPINNCDGSANEKAIKAVRYLQEVHHKLRGGKKIYQGNPIGANKHFEDNEADNEIDNTQEK